MCPVQVWLDGLVVAEGKAVWVRPVGGGHPAVVGLNDKAVRAVVCYELFDLRARDSAGELENVPHGGTAKTVQALVFVADDAEVTSGLGHFQEYLFLNEVGVLILVHHHVFDATNDGRRDGRIEKEVVNEFLEMREVDAIFAKEGFLVALIRL